MNYEYAVIILLFCLASIYSFHFARRARKKAKEYESVARSERVRSYFACLRGELLQLSLSEKVSPKGEDFEFLYIMSSFVMRRPDQYQSISAFFHKLVIDINVNRKSKNKRSINFENKPELKKLYIDFVKGIDVLIDEYPIMWKWMFRWIRKISKIVNDEEKIVNASINRNNHLKDLQAMSELKKDAIDSFGLSTSFPEYCV